MSEATYRIKSTLDGMCQCGHTGAAHGSNGFICCVCDCKQFVLKKEDPEPTPESKL